MHVRRAAVLRRELNRRHCRLGRPWADASPRGRCSRSYGPERSSLSAQHVLDASRRGCDGRFGESRANASAVAVESADTPRTRNDRCGGERIESSIASSIGARASPRRRSQLLSSLLEACGKRPVACASTSTRRRCRTARRLRPSWLSTRSCTRRARPPKRTWSAGSPTPSRRRSPRRVLAVSLSPPALQADDG